MKYYLCKYIPPRADFLATLSAEEQALMQQHGSYLNQLLEQGMVVAHGPVIDETGGYGMSLFQIADDQEVTALTSEDPMVRHGIGHYEHYAMLHLRVRA